RPLTVFLFILAIAIAFFFYRLGQSGRGEIPVPVSMMPDDAAEAMGISTATTPVATEQKVRLQFHWKQVDNLLALIVIGLAGAFLIGVQSYPAYRTTIFPEWASISVIVLTVALLIKNSLRRQVGPADILDIGMRSSGTEARQTAYILVGLFGL